jgi:formamidopyrimidine-DNA glycosylase
MPELPEVETTLRGIAPALTGRTITDVVVRNPALRWPVPEEVRRARDSRIVGCRRRAKYLLIELEGSLAQPGNPTGAPGGGLLMHLGMSGSLRICDGREAPRKHDHYDLVLEEGACLRFNDPRRFGALLWWDHPAENHTLLRDLGPEPLSDEFTGEALWRRSRGRKTAVKNFIMDGRIVVGVGNIYASEALFMAGIHPSRPAGRIAQVRYQALALSIRDVLKRAIRLGGTTLRDYLNSDSRPGYFAQELLVYEREGQPCFQCGTPIRRRVIGQRSSYYCHRCQR